MRSKPGQMGGQCRELPVVLDMGDETRNEDDVNVAGAELAPRDVDAAAKCVSGARQP